VSPLARQLARELQERPRHFAELVEAHLDVSWREFLHAWGDVRAADVLARDEAGRYLVPGDASFSA
jgi:hypothetical protein